MDLLLNDGTSLLLNDGSSVTLNEAGDSQSESTPSGGYAVANWRQIERNRQRRRELEEEADRLEMALAAEGLITPDPVVEARHTVRSYVPIGTDSRRTQRAIAYAERAQTALAYELALREIAKQMDEEDHALLMALALAA